MTRPHFILFVASNSTFDSTKKAVAVLLAALVRVFGWLLVSSAKRGGQAPKGNRVSVVQLVPTRFLDPGKRARDVVEPTPVVRSHPASISSFRRGSPRPSGAPTVTGIDAVRQPLRPGIEPGPEPTAAASILTMPPTAGEGPQQGPRELDLTYRPNRATRMRSAAELAKDPSPARSPTRTLEKQIGESARPGCKDAHAGLGLLAAPRLLWDAARDDGCKW